LEEAKELGKENEKIKHGKVLLLNDCDSLEFSSILKSPKIATIIAGSWKWKPELDLFKHYPVSSETF
jgi:hypothetical protein